MKLAAAEETQAGCPVATRCNLIMHAVNRLDACPAGRRDGPTLRGRTRAQLSTGGEDIGRVMAVADDAQEAVACFVIAFAHELTRTVAAPQPP